MSDTSNTIIKDLENKIKDFSYSGQMEKVGSVLEIGDGIAKVHGLSDVSSMEMVEFEGGINGLALNLERR